MREVENSIPSSIMEQRHSSWLRQAILIVALSFTEGNDLFVNLKVQKVMVMAQDSAAQGNASLMSIIAQNHVMNLSSFDS